MKMQFEGAVFVVVCVLACRRSPEPAPKLAIAPLHTDDAGSSGSDAAPPGPTWIVFDGPPGPLGTPMHGGPPWTFAWPQLPAISNDGGRAYLPEVADTGLAGVPNFSIRTLLIGDLDDGETTATDALLTVDEFDRALASVDKTAAFTKLGAIVEARVRKANEGLSSIAPSPMTPCVIAEPPWSAGAPYACAMTHQHAKCGATSLLFDHKTLDAVHAGTTKSHAVTKWKRPKLKTAYGLVNVLECLDDAYVDETRSIVLAHVVYACQAGGDWCSEESAWHVLK